VTAPERRIWSWLGLMFGAFYGAVLGAVYWVILTVVPSSISSGDLQGLAPLVVTSPHSIANALEGIGYGFMGLATLFAGLAVESGWNQELDPLASGRQRHCRVGRRRIRRDWHWCRDNGGSSHLGRDAARR